MNTIGPSDSSTLGLFDDQVRVELVAYYNRLFYILKNGDFSSKEGVTNNFEYNRVNYSTKNKPS